MATPAQIRANQANARLSTGPRSPAGKAASSRNSIRHGFCSHSVLLPGDDPADYEALLTDLRNHFDPFDLVEHRSVREMADAEWRLRRVRSYIQLDLTRKIEELAPLHPAASPLEVQALAYHALERELATWTRYESKFERQYERAYSTWTRHRQAKNKHVDADLLKHLCAVPDYAPARKPSPATSEPNFENRTNEANSSEPATPRSAPCPCGSGFKYKRCCGRNAPAVLSPAASCASLTGDIRAL